MLNINDVVKEVSQQTGEDVQIVDAVCKHVFKSAIDIMKSDTDVRDILFNRLFRFKLKRRYKENKKLNYLI